MSNRLRETGTELGGRKKQEEILKNNLEYLNGAFLSAGKMSKSSRLGRPSSGGYKQGPLRKELQGNRSCMLRVGERLMRAGSEGNLVRAQSTQQNQHQQPQEGRGMSLHTASNSAKGRSIYSAAPEKLFWFCLKVYLEQLSRSYICGRSGVSMCSLYSKK